MAIYIARDFPRENHGKGVYQECVYYNSIPAEALQRTTSCYVTLPPRWIPDSVILEGMLLIHSLQCQT